MIQCTRCRYDKEYSDFYNDPRNRNGKQSQCKACTNLPPTGIKTAKYDFNLKNLIWKEQAACKNKTNIFFPHSNPHLINKAAIKVCVTCPVQVECLEFALETKPREGTWAGLSPSSLYELRRPKPRNDGRHGNLIMYFGKQCRCLTCCRKVLRICDF